MSLDPGNRHYAFPKWAALLVIFAAGLTIGRLIADLQEKFF